MSTTLQERPRAVTERQQWFRAREMWAAVSITVIWLAVLFTAVFGPDIVSTSAGVNAATVPSVVVVVPFAFFATWPVAKYGFGRRDDRPG
jgi:hypothetical protein